jgi:hypothetical protein
MAIYVKHCSTFVLTFVQKVSKNNDLFLLNIHARSHISIKSRVFDPILSACPNDNSYITGPFVLR